jgi:CHAT domain-containing protein/tetratricopeptide (TPR) repeat protein
MNLRAQNDKRLSIIQQADKVYEQGMKQYKSGNYVTALESFDKSLILEKDISKESDPRYQNLLMWKAACFYKQGKVDQAKAVSPDYYLIDPIDRTKTVEADSLGLQAQEMLNNGNSSKALTLLQSEAEIEKKVVGAKQVYYANTLRNIADVFLMCGDGKSALPYYSSYKKIITPIYGEKSKQYAAAIDGMSSCYSYDSTKLANAFDLHTQAQVIYDSLKINKQECPYMANIALITPALAYFKAKQYANVIKLLSMMKDNVLIPDNNRLTVKKIYGTSNQSYGIELFSEKDYLSSSHYLNESIQYEDSSKYALSYVYLGSCYLSLKQYVKAKVCLLLAMQNSKDLATKQMACQFMGHAYYSESFPFIVTREYGKALDGYLIALKWYKDGGKPSSYVQAIRNVAEIYSNLKEWNKADSLYQIAFKIAFDEKDTMGIARSYYDMASMCCRRNDYNHALKYIDECYQLCMVIHDYAFAFATLTKKANLYILDLNNDYMASMTEKQCENLLKQMNAKEQKIYQPDIYSIQKDIQTKKGDYKQALVNLENLHVGKKNSIQSNESVLDSTAEYSLYLKEKINLLYKLNRKEEIRSCLDSLLSSHKDYSLEKRADEYITIGGFYLLIGDYDESVAELKKSIQIYQQLDKNERRCEKSYYYMGVAYADQKKFQEAHNALEKALSINSSYEPANNIDKESILYILANACAFGSNYNKAQEYYSKTVDLLKAIIKRDFAFLTEQERDGYWNSLQEDLQNIFAFGYKMKAFNCPFTTELYNSALFCKGLLLSSDNEISKLISKNPGLTLTRNDINKLQQEIESKQMKGLNVDSLFLKRQKMESDLLEKCNALYGNYTKFLSSDFKDIVAQLGEKDIALEFHNFRCGKDSTMYCVFVLKRGMNNPQMVPLFEKKDLDNLYVHPACTFSAALSYDTEADHNYIYSSKELGQLVWGKILPYLNDVQRVYFSPSGMFQQLGIENLPLENGKTFSEHYVAYRLSSTRELATTNQVSSSGEVDLYGGLQYNEEPQTMTDMSHKNRRDLELSDNLTLAFGDSLTLYERAKACYGIKKDSSQTVRAALEVNELPFTKEEVADINTELTKSEVNNTKNVIHPTVFTGTEGNEESFKALSGTSPKIIHIATHGFFLPQTQAEEFNNKRSFLMGLQEQQKTDVDFSLSRSGLLMAGARKAWMGEAIPDSIDDGILTAREIAHLDLRGTDLVVLSACETGLGDVTGEGVFGLQRGFKKAGVNTLVMSLWKVDDKATKMMMTQFYGNLVEGQTKRAAFLNAQKYLKDYVIQEKYDAKITSDMSQEKREDLKKQQGDIEIIHPYASPQFWAAFIMLDGIK